MRSNFSLARCAAAARLDGQGVSRKVPEGIDAEYAAWDEGGGVGEARGSAVGLPVTQSYLRSREPAPVASQEKRQTSVLPIQTTGTGVTAELRQGRSDQGSSPCSRTPQSHARTPARSRCIRRLPRGLGAGSGNRRRDQRRSLST